MTLPSRKGLKIINELVWCQSARVHARSLQSRLTLRNSMGYSCPWNSPGKNSEVGCHFLLQGIFPTQGLQPHILNLLHWQVSSLLLSPPTLSGKRKKFISVIFIFFPPSLIPKLHVMTTVTSATNAEGSQAQPYYFHSNAPSILQAFQGH